MVYTHQDQDEAPQSNCYYQLKDTTLGRTGFRCLTEAQYNEMVEARSIENAQFDEWFNNHWYYVILPIALIILFLYWLDV